MPYLRLVISTAAILVCSFPCLAVETTRIFRQGVDGYTGVRDTRVSSQTWGTPPRYALNHGLDTTVVVDRNGRANTLVAFDLSSIPSNSSVSSATLELYNQTAAGQGFDRRIQAFRILSPWAEGNQTGSGVDQPGDRGTTGDDAFAFPPGEGSNVPWSARGLAAGDDYADVVAAFADVAGEGWYTWDVTALVRSWVRGEQPNHGLVLVDATGYQEGNHDSRSLVSSQGALAQRPRLTVVYDPDAPFARAGDDVEILDWPGTAVTLDGSASSAPGGGPLGFQWRVAEAAFGAPPEFSPGSVLGTEAVLPFQPPVAGEWRLELEVSAAGGESATDDVAVRLLSIQSGHPRLFLTAAKLAQLRARANAGTARWQQLQAEADSQGGQTLAKALVSQVTGVSSYCGEAIAQALADVADPGMASTEAARVALVYDWCYDQLSTSDRDTLLAYFAAYPDAEKPNDAPGYANYWPRWSQSYAFIGLAAFGDHPDARSWFDEYRRHRFADVDRGLLDRIAAGGGWPEGTAYDWIACMNHLLNVVGWKTATGEDLARSSPWFRERFGFLLLRRWPGIADDFGYAYHPYPSIGDTERNRGSLGNLGRILALALIEQFPDEPLARQLQAYLAAPPTAASRDFVIAWEFLFFDPEGPSDEPALRSHLAAGTGTAFMRSGWPSGAVDDDPSATHVTFQCGDHFTYHQHYDQGSFTLFKGGDLAVEAGVYSGDGRSYQDVNYEARTLAHNSLVVYNPAEDFGAVRPGAVGNDGGQRSPFPATRLPPDIGYFERNEVYYERCDIEAKGEADLYTYFRADATAAYNNPSYNQAMDTALTGNIAKVQRFQREFVYLRPALAGGGDYVVLYDRVGVTEAAFSGENTKLLIHTLVEPAVDGSPVQVSPGETFYGGARAATVDLPEAVATALNAGTAARLHVRVLRPAAVNLRVVGGRGEKASWAFGENYDWHWSAAETQPRPSNDFEPLPYGEWRLEIEPADTALEHNFLTVLHPSEPAAALPATSTILAGGLEGVYLADPDLGRVLLFSAAADGSPPAGTLTYTVPSTARSHHLLVDLAPGTGYTLGQDTGSGRTITLTPGGSDLVVDEEGVLSFEAGGSGPLIFADGFESGDTSAWASALP